MRRHYIRPEFPRPFYERLRAARSEHRLVEEFVIPEVTGRAFVVKRGSTARFVTVEGPQIADVDVFNANDPAERLWANQTLNREGFWLTRFSRLWSNMPRFRPLMTIIEDTVRVPPGEESYHHHIFGGHCNPFYWLLATGRPGHPSCYGNLVSAIEPFGLGPEQVHDNLNLFQKTTRDSRGMLDTVQSDAVAGDFVEFYAEMDVLVAVSLCPRGSGRTAPTDPVQDTHPLRIEIYETGTEPLEFTYERYVKQPPG